MPKSRIEMSRRRRLTAETIPPPPPEPEAVINGLRESEFRGELESIARHAMANPELCAKATRFLETFAVAEARELIEHVLTLSHWSLDLVEKVADNVLLAGEALAEVVNEKRDEEFRATQNGEPS
jgi:hypothetical protein